jgi:excinuclease ABC subunit A
VLDEPSTGLHPADIERLRSVIDRLHHRGNTIVMVEHDAELVLSAQRVVEIGPGAGEQGGEIVFDGTPAELLKSDTLTADYLVGRRGRIDRPQRRPLDRGRIKLIGARGHNLQSLTVEFPLGVFCVVSGVSGAGKSSLVRGTLYPALRRRLHRESTNALDHEEVLGAGQIDDVVLVEPAPLGRTARSNPVTYVKAFQEIRRLFAETPAAKARNILASHFSFNMPGGRCDKCQGDGSVVVDMQFLADVRVPCDQCQGRRYRDEILKVTYRQHNIAEVLELTVRQAFGFFRGQPAIQSRLKPLIDVGLDYLRLGQPASTLSGGEAQRLRLAGYLGKSKRLRTLLILDEPTTGLHMADIVQLVDVLDALLAVGHSLIVIEHNMQLMQYADWIIDLGPGAADAGGRVVAEGTPEQIAACPQSITGKYLRERLA